MGFIDKDEANRYLDLENRNALRAEYLRVRNDLSALRNAVNNDHEKRENEVVTAYNTQIRILDANYDAQIAVLNSQFANKEPYKTLATQNGALQGSMPVQSTVTPKTEADLAKEPMDKKRQQYIELQYDKYLKTLSDGTIPMTSDEFLKTLQNDPAVNKQDETVTATTTTPEVVNTYTSQDSLYYKNYLIGFPAGAELRKTETDF